MSAPVPRLELRQSQSLQMTQGLRQAIELLQMPATELQAYVAEAMEKNPLLGESEREEDGPAESYDGGAERDEAPEAEHGSAPVGEGEVWSGTRDGAAMGGDTDPLALVADRPPSLREHLLDQLHLDVVDPATHMIGSYLIDLLDDAGYLHEPLASVAQSLGCTEADAEAALAIVQRLDPVGIGARTLSECLALQLRERDRLDPAMQALLDHLGLVASHDYTALKRACGVNDEDLRDMLAEIRALNPKPGNAFGSENTVVVIPDVFVRQQPGGRWVVELNPDALPRVLVNRQYYAEVRRHARDKESKLYLSEQLATANWLIKALDQRAQSILKVASAIVEYQRGFFEQGVRAMRPLTLRQIAETVEVHESTVSRVTAGKYLSTPRGLFEMRYFFTSAVSGGDEGGVSSEAVKHRIRALIDAESPTDILSDDDLVTMLAKEDIALARRTVAKYREAMGIGSSVQRRREKALKR